MKHGSYGQELDKHLEHELDSMTVHPDIADEHKNQLNVEDYKRLRALPREPLAPGI